MPQKPVLFDPVMRNIVRTMEAGNIFSDTVMNGDKLRSPNYTMPARNYKVLDKVPHWFPQFRAEVKNGRMLVGNLYALPIGQQIVSYKSSPKSLIFGIGIEDLPFASIESCIGKEVKDIVSWKAIPDDLIVTKASFIPADNESSIRAPRTARQPLASGQLRLVVDDFAWKSLSMPDRIERTITQWADGSFNDRDGNTYNSVADFISETHGYPVDAQLCHYLCPGHPSIARLWIENAFDPGGRTFSPHLCLKRSLDRWPKHTALRTLRGSWIRRRQIPGYQQSTEWMIPIGQNTKKEIGLALKPYHVVVVDENNAISAYRGAISIDQRYKISNDEIYMQTSRGDNVEDNSYSLADFNFRT